MRREADPRTRRLLTEALRLEGEPWPEVIEIYRATLFALALRCEFPPGQAEFYRWGRHVAHRLLTAGRRRAEYRHDALADIATRAFTRVLMWRAGVDHRRLPDIRSLLRRGIYWRAKDLARSTERRHWRNRALADVSSLPAADSPHQSAVARSTIERLARDDSPPARALLLIASGETLASATRLTGASRSRIQRFREQLRA